MVAVKYIKSNYILAGISDPAPPLGTVLGNIGVNTTNFCNQFNLFTKELPSYFRLKVEITIFVNNNFSFVTKLPSTSYFINLLRYERIVKVKLNDKMNDKIIFCVNLNELVKLARLKFSELPLKQALSTIIGTVKSMNITISK